MGIGDQILDIKDDCLRIANDVLNELENDSLVNYRINPINLPSLPFVAGDLTDRTTYEAATGIKITKMYHHLYVPEFESIIKMAASKYGMDWTLLAAHISAESGYTIDCVSKTGAYGIAQFMPGPAIEYGMIVAKGVEWQVGSKIREFPITTDSNKDERLKPEKAIMAMAKKDARNFKKFNDWQLAITAYNRGTAGTNRILKESGKDKAILWGYVNKIWAKREKIEKQFK